MSATNGGWEGMPAVCRAAGALVRTSPPFPVVELEPGPDETPAKPRERTLTAAPNCPLEAPFPAGPPDHWKSYCLLRLKYSEALLPLVTLPSHPPAPAPPPDKSYDNVLVHTILPAGPSNTSIKSGPGVDDILYIDPRGSECYSSWSWGSGARQERASNEAYLGPSPIEHRFRHLDTRWPLHTGLPQMGSKGVTDS